MDLEDIMLINKAQDKYCRIPFEVYEVSKVVKFIETESRMMVGCHKLRKGEVGYCLIGTEFQFCRIKTFWISVAQQCEYT